jgi:RimJ/RimL family protein N-acetyltransferase
MDTPIPTRRLILRPLQASDAGPMFAYRSRPDVSRYQIWQPANVSEIRDFIEKQKTLAFDTPGTWFSLAIVLRESGEMIGDIGLHFLEAKTDEMEIGITLSPAFQKRGFAVEALEEIFRFLFFSKDKDRITASVDPRNLASIRLLERAGMQKKAYFREKMVIRGELVDDVVYAVGKEEFRTRIKKPMPK